MNGNANRGEAPTEPQQDAPEAGRLPPTGLLADPRRLARIAKIMGFTAAIVAVSAVLVSLFVSPTGAVLVLGLALAMATVPVVAFALAPLPQVDEADEELAFRGDLFLNGYTIVLSIAFLTLGLINVLAIFAAFGAFLVFGDFAENFVNLFVVVLAGPVGLLALAIPLAATSNTKGARRLSRQALQATWITLGATALLGVLTLGTAFGALDALGIGFMKSSRASFVLAFAAITAYLAARNTLRLPDLRAVAEWIEHEPRFRDSNIPKATVIAASALSGLAVILSLLAGFGVLPETTAIYAVVGAIATILVAAFSMGVTHVETRLEFGEGVEGARHLRKLILGTLSVALGLLALVLAIVTGLAFLAQVANVALFKDLLRLFVDNHPLILALALLPLLATVIARVYVPTDVKYTERAKALSAVLVTVIAVSTFYGGFIGSGLAQGAGIELSNAVLMLSTAVIALTLFVKIRALLPGIVSMMRERIDASAEADTTTKETIRRNMIATYVVSTVLLLAFTGVIVAASLGVLPVQEGVAFDLTLFGVFVGGIILLVVLVMRYFQGVNIDPQWAKKQKEEDIGKKRLTPEELNRYLILGFSSVVAVTLTTYGALVYAEIFNALGPIDLEKQHATDFFVFALLLGLGPYGWYQNKEAARMRAIDSKFPEFLRDLAESERSGMTLTQAVVTASKGNYGALTWEIRKMGAQIEWGISFTEAIERFAKRVRTPLIERTVSLIVEASNAGGSVMDVLSAAAEDSREIQLILKERKASMSIYVMIIYVAFCVFVGVVAILNAMFIPEVAKAMANADGVKIGGVTFQKFDEGAFKIVFFHAAIIQGLGGGLVAGVMEGGKPVNGLKHAFIMIIIAYVVFRFLLI